MPKAFRRYLAASLFALILLVLLGVSVGRWNARVRASRASLAEIAARYPAGSPQRATALRREMTRRHHPRWTDLSTTEIAARIEMLAARALARPRAFASSASPGAPGIAPFLGDYTAISAPSGQAFVLLRQSDCSLTYESGTYMRDLSNPGYTIQTTTPHYDQTLHQLAGMTNGGGAFPAGCAPHNGSMTRGAFLGKTSQNLYVFATDGYDPTTQNNALYYGTADAAYHYHSLAVDDSNPQIHAIAGGDLNQDGNGDVIELSYGSCSINVLLGKSDGSFQSGVPYNCGGSSSQGAVVADFNGDGKPDVAVLSKDGYVTLLSGKGDGTLQPGQPLQLSSAAVSSGGNLIAADTRNMGRNDIIVSDGHVLLSNGDGTFTPGNSIAFQGGGATSEFGPNLSVADLNKDGKLDLVYSDGYTIDIYQGAGDGTFTAGHRYATIDNVGYVTVADIDGDGNLDIYSGMAGGSFFSGDQFELAESYVLLGKGDGTFVGAPAQAASYTGNNLADVNGDGKMDLVSGASSGQGITFTTYTGQSDGGFAVEGTVLSISTIAVSNISQGAANYANPPLRSFAVGDVNGDGRADVVFIPDVLTSYWQRSILCVSAGNADGSLAQPSCTEIPSLLTNPGTLPTGGTDFDSNLVADHLHLLDLNGDGKLDVFYTYQDQDYGSGMFLAGYVVQAGKGDATFSGPKITQLYSNTNAPTPSQLPPPSVFADLNGDSRPDLVSTVQTGNYPSFFNTTYLNLNKGDGTFNTASTLQFGVQVLDSAIVAADMNGDGKADLVVVGDDGKGNGSLSINLSNGDGTFAQPKLTPISAGDDLNGIALGDFNADGKLDVVLLSYQNIESGIYYGNGDGTVQTSTDGNQVIPDAFIPLNVGGPALAYDFDGDGKLDLLAGDILLHAVNAPASGTTPPALLASITSVSASPTSAAPGQAVALAATVAGPSGTTLIPAGTVTFLDGVASIGTGTLDNTGKATLTTNSLASGTHPVTASYAGDANFAASVSSAVTVTITAPPADFNLTSSSGAGTTSAAQPATATLTVISANGFASTVSFACSGLPANVSCSFSPSTVKPAAAAPASTTVTFNESSATALLYKTTGLSLASAGFGVWALLLRGRKSRLEYGLGLVLVGVAFLLLFTGCGSGGIDKGKTTGPFTVTITATSGSLAHTTQYALTVQN